jgi:hypothetical protein
MNFLVYLKKKGKVNCGIQQNNKPQQLSLVHSEIIGELYM